MTIPRVLFGGLILLAIASGCGAVEVTATEAQIAAMRQRVAALGQLTAAPAVYPVDSANVSPRRLYFAALPYRGKPTRCFAWMGLPETRGTKVPGVVLVHGGGGTAFREWVERWNEHGFAAISIAVEGQTDERSADGKWWQQHEWAGPKRAGIYDDAAEPIEDQWMYHAVADVALANSLLRSLREVDAEQVGLSGISWGGIITSTAMGIDTRFAFAVPIYGCGQLPIAAEHYVRALEHNQVYREVWEPTTWLPRARMPALWLTWLRDTHFPLDAQQATYRAALGPRMVAVLPDMRHGHTVGWRPEDSYAFAESVVATGKPWLKQLHQERDGDRASVEFESAKPIDRAVLLSTIDTGYTGSRQWTESAAELKLNGAKVDITAPLPAGTTAYFFNVLSGPLTASSEYVDMVKPEDHESTK
ncbi:MAG TPA: acetylxylan esterase [Pirellulales bacterium]|jgi:dienelactone hydrolase|nr:acetylxylan esterase [Pirellulales bacterium]